MSPESTVNEDEKAKFDAHQSDWWNKNGPLKTLHDINPARLSFVENYIQLSNHHILDVGCGGGVFSEALAKKAKKVTGLDISQSAIDIAINHAKKSNLAIEYICSPIEDISDCQFDAITCMEMLEHVDSPELVIQNCHRLMKKGGWLFLSTINRTPMAYAQVILAAEYIFGLLPRQTHDYKKFIKPSELSTMCRHNGFDVCDIGGLKYNPVLRSARLCDSPSVNYLMACRKNS